MNSERREIGRGMALGPFLLVGILFLMPWVEVSCSGIPLVKLTGAELAIGTSIENPRGGGAQQVPGDTRALIVFLLVLLALPVALLPERPRNLLLCLMSASQVALLLFMLAALKIGARQAEIPVSVEVQWPYWASVVCLGAAAIVFGSQPLTARGVSRRVVRAPAVAAPVVAAVRASGSAVVARAAFCSQCGNPRIAGGAFCGSCGKRLA